MPPLPPRPPQPPQGSNPTVQAAQRAQQMMGLGSPGPSRPVSGGAPGAGAGCVVGVILAAALIAGGILTTETKSQSAAMLFLGAVVALPLITSAVVARARRSFLAGMSVGWVSGLTLAIASVVARMLLHGAPSLGVAGIYLVLCVIAGLVGGLFGRLIAGRG